MGWEFFEPNHWHWWILAIGFLTLEVILPGTFFIWIGIAAFGVGLVMFFQPGLQLETQLLIFSIVSVVSVILSRIYFAKYHPKEAHSLVPHLNRRGSEHIGRIVLVVEPIVHGMGKVQIADGYWLAEGPDCPVNTSVKIIDIKGTRLQVEPVTPPSEIKTK